MKSILCLLSIAMLASSARAVEPPAPAKAHANQMVEFDLTTMVKRVDPFNEVTVDAIFTEPGGKQRRVPAFWAGERKWKVRYASPIVGEHTFRTEASDAGDGGLHHVTGRVQVTAYAGANPLYKHGPLRVAKDKRHFEHADGTPFLWLGDTWWMGLTKRLSFPEEFDVLLADRKAKGFNLIQIVAGLYPDMPAFDPRGENETGFPWEPAYKAVRPAYFDAADRRIFRLVEEGFTPCIVSTWGYHLSFLGAERMKQHQRYVYARWGALPIVWCVAGEFNLPFYTSPEFPAGAPAQAKQWEAILPYCRSINAFDRPLTAHPWLPQPMSARARLSDPTLLDFDMLQTGHGQMEIVGPSGAAARGSYDAKPTMPVVNAEPSYEMLMDKTPAEVARAVFWASWANGVKGYTYGANGIWQVNGREKRYGASPHGGDYGKIPWQDAMHLGGSTQVALGTKLLAQYPWHRFEPKPDWAAWAPADADAIADVPVGEWIWFPEGKPATDAPVAPRFFRRTFDLPADAKVKRAALHAAADDACTVWLNGAELGSHGDWNSLKAFDGVAAKLRAGRNVLAIRAENVASNVTANPAGLTAGLAVELEDGQRIEIPTGADWRVSRDEAAGWQQIDYDDKAWQPAQSAALFGAAPWGRVTVGGTDPNVVPYAFGVPREVRFVYMPKPGAVMVKQLEPDVRYAASHVDPATGARKPIGEVKPDEQGNWGCPPIETSHDWLLILEAAK